MKIVGIAEVNYRSEKTGREVHGFDLYGTYPSKRCMIGEAVGKEYVSATVAEQIGLPNVGDEVEFTYNRYGKIAGYDVISEEA